MKWSDDAFEVEGGAASASPPLAPATHVTRLAVILPAVALAGASIVVGVSAWLRSDAGSIVAAAIRALAASGASHTAMTLSGVAVALAPTVAALVIWWLDLVRGPKSEV